MLKKKVKKVGIWNAVVYKDEHGLILMVCEGKKDFDRLWNTLKDHGVLRTKVEVTTNG